MENHGDGRSAFPAGAGMNRWRAITGPQKLRVPRRRGDEPSAYDAFNFENKRSPQARG